MNPKVVLAISIVPLGVAVAVIVWLTAELSLARLEMAEQREAHGELGEAHSVLTSNFAVLAKEREGISEAELHARRLNVGLLKCISMFKDSPRLLSECTSHPLEYGKIAQLRLDKK